MFRYLREKIGTSWIGIRMNKILGLMELMIMKLYKDPKVTNLIKEISP